MITGNLARESEAVDQVITILEKTLSQQPDTQRVKVNSHSDGNPVGMLAPFCYYYRLNVNFFLLDSTANIRLTEIIQTIQIPWKGWC